jgi:3-deoxy-manno-octulosonate cytidylyltransferase (CMP-KDO synthetase)
MKHLIVIPTRMDSTRFPGKPLALINGKEMILHVAERASEAGDVVIATPDKVIYDLVTKHGFNCYITKTECLTGTDRVCEVANKYKDYDIFVNVQGDEPLIEVEDIQSILISKILCYNVVINSVCRLHKDDCSNKNVVKATLDKKQHINKLTRKGVSNYKHCGVYAYNRRELKAYENIPFNFKKQFLHDNENIEMLLFTYLGYRLKAEEIIPTQAVDVLDDIKKIMEVIHNGKN